MVIFCGKQDNLVIIRKRLFCKLRQIFVVNECRCMTEIFGHFEACPNFDEHKNMQRTARRPNRYVFIKAFSGEFEQFQRPSAILLFAFISIGRKECATPADT